MRNTKSGCTTFILGADNRISGTTRTSGTTGTTETLNGGGALWGHLVSTRGWAETLTTTGLSRLYHLYQLYHLYHLSRCPTPVSFCAVFGVIWWNFTFNDK
jgi:hypothetical protein